MTDLMLQVLAFMLCTFILGIALGWAIWRFEDGGQQAQSGEASEVDFWRRKHDQSRNELWNEQEKLTAVQQEKTILQRRIAAMEEQIAEAKKKS